jgi:hypothetical protein
MLDNYITQYSDINTFFLPNDPLVYPDNFYLYNNIGIYDVNLGMNTANNLYNYYNQLTNGTEMVEVNQRLFANMQLQTFWGMSQDQAAEFTSNWNELYWTQYNNLTTNTTINPYMPNSNNTEVIEFNVVYWQWVNSTYSQNLGGYNSWKNVSSV